MTAGACRSVTVLGECMIELRQGDGQSVTSGFAGDTLNTASYLRRLLPREQFNVRYVTALGDDPLSAQMLAAWQAEGIDTSAVRRIPGALPGLYWIRTDQDGEREFFYWREQAAARRVLDDNYAATIADSLSAGDFFYLSGISAAIVPAARRDELHRLLPDLRQRGVTVAYDTNFRPRLWPDVAAARMSHTQMLAACDMLITSHIDEAALFGDVDIDATLARIRAQAGGEWVVRGEPGVTWTGTDGCASATPIDSARVVDTTGAGDSFGAAYFAARLSGLPAARAIDAGHALAAIVVQYGGAIIGREQTPVLDRLLGS